MELSARLQKIVFQNSETGFLIGSFLIEDVLPYALTAKGSMMNPQVGLTYKLKLQEEPANKYGKQYKIVSYETLLPMDPNGIFKYITRICKFVGEVTGGKIVDKYGVETLDIMKCDPERLSKEISGITYERALEIQETLCINETNERLMVDLEALLDVPGMHKDISIKLIAEFAANAVDILKHDPYIITIFPGIGFILADQVAIQKVGYDPMGLARKKSLALYCLREEMAVTGSTWIPERALLARMKELVDVPDLDAGLIELESKRVLVSIPMVFNQIKTRLWSFESVHQQELRIAAKISNFLHT